MSKKEDKENMFKFILCYKVERVIKIITTSASRGSFIMFDGPYFDNIHGKYGN